MQMKHFEPNTITDCVPDCFFLFSCQFQEVINLAVHFFMFVTLLLRHITDLDFNIKKVIHLDCHINFIKTGLVLV